MLVVIAAIFMQWLRSDTREARRHERREALRSAGETELDSYNRYLSRLHEADERRERDDADPARTPEG
jgi:putative copper resistance protein D